MKKEYISTLEINGQDREIYIKDKMKHYGLCLPDKQEIHIQKKEYNRKFVNDTVVHELLHAIWNEHCINHKKLSEEEIVSRLSKAIVAILEQVVPEVEILEVIK